MRHLSGLRGSSHSSIAHTFGANHLWEQGYSGKGVSVAVFDTGLKKAHPHFRNVRERTNWTNEPSLDDGVGHGTHVAGVIASQSSCLGFAPDADLYIFRLFTNDQVSYTSWFLDAFNYAIHLGIDVLNLSIGGPDFMDKPFVDKVWELSANGVIVVSAIGNDGPLYGTLNNPADQLDVIGVGGITYEDTMAAYSSRGMTLWELPYGYGRMKPDIVTYSQNIRGSHPDESCHVLSGTSVASPIVAGIVTLLSSSVAQKSILNPASMKQALISTAVRIPNAHIFEQGAGRVNLLSAHSFLSNYSPHVSIFPSSLDLTNCPYMWPYCAQPLFFSGSPAVINATILNGVSVVGHIASAPKWVPGINGQHVRISVSYSEILWPWTGYLAICIQVEEQARHWQGISEGVVQIEVVAAPYDVQSDVYVVSLPIKVSIVPTPAREKRVLWDQFHNLNYPSGYFPRDNLHITTDILDWNGDHLHTNFRPIFDALREQGYFLDILTRDWTCFDASNYGAIMIVDPEEDFFVDEIAKLQSDILNKDLSLVIMADWYDSELTNNLRFFDENTRSWWTPVTGGANVPALNELLDTFGIELSNSALSGLVRMANGQDIEFLSGTSIIRFPQGGMVAGRGSPLRKHTPNSQDTSQSPVHEPILGGFHTQGGRIVIFGDSNCMDMSHNTNYCTWLVNALIDFATGNSQEPSGTLFFPQHKLVQSLDPKNPTRVFPDWDLQRRYHPAVRLENSEFHHYSKVHVLKAAWRDGTPIDRCGINQFNELYSVDDFHKP